MYLIRIKRIISIKLYMCKKGEYMVLSKEELSNVYGGGVKFGLFAALGGLITLFVGMIDGYLRPLKCNR